MLEVEHVSKKFKEPPSLVDVNLKVNQGDVVVILGPLLDQEKQPSYVASTTWKRQIQAT